MWAKIQEEEDQHAEMVEAQEGNGEAVEENEEEEVAEKEM